MVAGKVNGINTLYLVIKSVKLSCYGNTAIAEKWTARPKCAGERHLFGIATSMPPCANL